MLRRTHSVLLLASLLVSVPPVEARPFEALRAAFSRRATLRAQQRNDRLVQNNLFTVERGGRLYGQYLTPASGYETFERKQPKDRALLFRYLRRLPADALWVDMGAGEAVAQREYLAEGGKAKTVALGVTRPAVEALASAERTYGDRFRYLAGQYVEKYELHDLQSRLGARPHVITDLLGPMTYTDRPDVVLDRYVRLLDRGGKVFVTIPEETLQLRRRDGSELSVADWLASIPGLAVTRQYRPSVKDGHPYLSFVIEKQRDDVELPPLELVRFESQGKPGWTPTRVLEER